MTHRLLHGLAHVHGPAWLLALLGALALGLLPLALLLDLARWMWRHLRLARIERLHAVRCPNGHWVVIWDDEAGFACGACGFTTVGLSGFAPCACCGERAAYVTCACGTSIQNPAFLVENG